MALDLKRAQQSWPIMYKIKRALWATIWNSLFRWGPRAFSPIRVAILRLFGAEIGNHVLFCGNVKVLEPWNIRIGDATAISEEVDFYNFETVTIGDNCVISRAVFFCCATHRYDDAMFPLVRRPIIIGSHTWIAHGAFIHPGVNIGNECVIGARSVVVKNVPPHQVWAGNPAFFLRSK